MQNIFNQAIANVNAAYPSIYTKDDVVKLITDLRSASEQQSSGKTTVDLDMITYIKESVREGIKEIAFEDFVELELSYDNRIDISVDDRGIAKEIEEYFDAAVGQILSMPKEAWTS